MIGIPWMVAFALRADGWWLRSDIIWAKTNPMPESVTDRPTKAHEYVFLLSKSKRYFYDADAIREPHTATSKKRYSYGGSGGNGRPYAMQQSPRGNMAGRNKRTVWTIATRPYAGAHFACVDGETEALTPQGWKRESKLTNGDLIAGYDPQTDSWYWQKATFHRYDYNWKMVQIEKRETSQLLTPEHRCPVRRRVGHQGQDGWGFDVVMAHQLQPAYELLLSAQYREQPLFKRLGITLAALLGWFVTDGSIRESGAVRLYQSRSANSWKCDQIRKLLDDYGAEYSERTRHREWKGQPSVMVNWHITGKLAVELRELAPDKKLTPGMTELPKQEVRALFEAIIDGDGCRRDDGRLQVIQKDKEHIDAMQILAVRLGYKTMVSHRKDNTHSLYITDKKWLTLRGTCGTHKALPIIDYQGIVWCPSIDTGFGGDVGAGGLPGVWGAVGEGCREAWRHNREKLASSFR
jgi:hypothetical protein